MARHNQKYNKSSFCIYCGKQSLGKPFCLACSKKYFNFDKDFKINDFIVVEKKKYPSEWLKKRKSKINSPLHREYWLSNREINRYKNNPHSRPKNWLTETNSQYADRVDKLLNGDKNNQFTKPTFISQDKYLVRKEWEERRERLYKKWSDRRK